MAIPMGMEDLIRRVMLVSDTDMPERCVLATQDVFGSSRKVIAPALRTAMLNVPFNSPQRN